MANDLYVSGLSDLNKMLQDFPAKLEGNIMRGAMRAGSSVFRRRIRESVPIRSGALQKSVKLRTKSRRGRVSATVSVGSTEAFYAHMIEFGTASFYQGSGRSVRAPYKITKKNKKALKFGNLFAPSIVHPGIKPQPFMRPAMDQGQAEALEAVAAYIRSRIGKEMLK